MTRASNPASSMLLDRSTAHPGNFDKSIFARTSGSGSQGGSASGRTTSQGTVNSNYLRECREDNPEPANQDAQTRSVTLGKCCIETPLEQLATDQPFEMSVEVATGDGKPAAGKVSFRLFCCTTKSDGTESSQDQSLLLTGDTKNGKAIAKGTLISPKQPVPAGAKLKYYVVAEHLDAKEKSESPKAEVAAYKPPQPLAVCAVDARHFGFGGFFLLPSATEQIAEFQKQRDRTPGAAIAIFGHGTQSAETESGRRAFATRSLLTKDASGWLDLAKSAKPGQWDVRATRTMLSALKGKSGSPYYSGRIEGGDDSVTESALRSFQKDHALQVDGKAGPRTTETLVRLYMDTICAATMRNDDFVGDPKDAKRQWACAGCGSSNPVRVSSESPENSGRVTLFLFPEGAKGPGKVTFPCPAWSDAPTKCQKEFFEDADKRKTPTSIERTWEKDKDTFACKFYAEIGKVYATTSAPSASVDPSDQGTPIPIYEHHFHDDHFFPNLASDEFLEVLAGLVEFHRTNGECPLAVRPDSASERREIFEKRLRVAESIVHGNETTWAELTKDATPRDVQTAMKFFFLKGWPCDPGTIDGVAGPKTKQAVYQFQHACNSEWQMKLSTDGKCGPKTWNAILYTFGIFIGTKPIPQKTSD